jgi:tetratricopeptide (TPR) repeat protein
VKRISTLARIRNRLLAFSCVAGCCSVLAAEVPASAVRQAFAAGDYSGAIRLIEANSELSGDCGTMLLLGLSRYRLHRLEHALIDLQAAVACDENSTAAHTALAEAWLQKGDDRRALALFESVLKAAPEDPAALSGAAGLYLRHDLNSQAAEVLEKLIRMRPEDSKAHSELGAARAGLNDLGKARESFEAALRIDPRNVSALVGLGHLEVKSGRPEQAVRLLLRAATLDPGAFEPHFLLATAWSDQKRYEDAIRECKEALRLGGGDPQIYYHLARAYRAAGDEEGSRKAMAQFAALRAKANENDEKQREATRLTEQARAMLDGNRLSEAITLLERSRTLGGSNPQLLFRLAGLYYDTRQFDRAREDVEAAIELAPAEWTYYYLAGLIDKSTGKLEQAAKSLSTAARLHPSGAEVFNDLGNVAMAQRNYSEAIRAFTTAAQLDPREPAYKTNAKAARELAGK